MKVWMIRHGQSETNKAGLWTGWLDVPLTEEGRADAALAATILSKTKFDKIYTSDLQRARMTAEIAIPGCTYECTPMLREVNVGDIAGKPLGILTEQQRAAIAREGYSVVGGESKEQFADRIGAFMRLLESVSCESIAVFAHNGVVRKFLDLVMEIDAPRKKMIFGNCGIAVFEYSNSTWRLYSWINLK